MKRQQAMEEEDRKLKLKEIAIDPLGLSSKASKIHQHHQKVN